MTYLSSSKDCVRCGSNHKGSPFCTYVDGVHCFSCGYTEKYDRSFSIKEHKQIVIPNQTECKSSPDGFSINNLLWLSKYYITPDLIRKHSIVEAPDGALIFSVIKDDVVVHCQKRYIREQRFIMSYGPKTPLISSVGSDTIVLVEDPLSCIRVGEHADSACLWGVKADIELLKTLLPYTKIIVWLDNDTSKDVNTGQIAANKICKSLEYVISLYKRRYAFGNIIVPSVYNIVTEHDPKVYSPTEIKEILCISRTTVF